MPANSGEPQANTACRFSGIFFCPQNRVIRLLVVAELPAIHADRLLAERVTGSLINP